MLLSLFCLSENREKDGEDSEETDVDESVDDNDQEETPISWAVRGRVSDAAAGRPALVRAGWKPDWMLISKEFILRSAFLRKPFIFPLSDQRTVGGRQQRPDIRGEAGANCGRWGWVLVANHSQ